LAQGRQAGKRAAGKPVTLEQMEVSRLKAEKSRLKMEVEILKKATVAFFSTSFSIRSIASSRRNLAISSSSSATLRLPGGGAGIVDPRLAAMTQFDSVPLGIDSRCAAASSDIPCSSTRWTASARNSGV
jgi:hypothetical protein